MNTDQLFKHSFFVFLFLLPFQTVYLLREPFIGGEKWQYGTIALYGTDILLLFLFIVWIWNITNRRSRNEEAGTKNDKASFVLIGFLLWGWLSILWAGDRWLAFSFSIILLLAVGLSFLARAIPIDNTKKIVFVFLSAGVIQSSIGIAQFLYQKSVNLSILGMNGHPAYEAGSSVLKIDSGRFLRAYGTFSHPNILGGFLGIILLLGVAYYVLYVRYEKSWKTVFDIVFLLVGSIIILLGLILSFSRSAWLGVVIGILALGVLVFLRKEWDVRVRFFKILFALGLASIVFGFLLHEQIFPRFDTAIIEREGSVTERVQSLQDAGTIISEGNLLFGTGIGNFTAEVIRLQPERPVWNIQPAHNVFVLLFVELGAVGLLLFVVFLGSIIMKLSDFSQCSQSDRKTLFQSKNALFGIALLVFVPSLFLDHFLWSSHFGLFFFFLILGLASRR